MLRALFLKIFSLLLSSGYLAYDLLFFPPTQDNHILEFPPIFLHCWLGKLWLSIFVGIPLPFIILDLMTSKSFNLLFYLIVFLSWTFFPHLLMLQFHKYGWAMTKLMPLFETVFEVLMMTVMRIIWCFITFFFIGVWFRVIVSNARFLGVYSLYSVGQTCFLACFWVDSFDYFAKQIVPSFVLMLFFWCFIREENVSILKRELLSTPFGPLLGWV